MSPYIESEIPVFYGKKVMCRVKVFFQMYIKGHCQGHVIKIYKIYQKVVS